MNSDLQQQLIKDLLLESFEGLDNFDQELLALETSGATGSTDVLNRIFRIIHTIKGTSGCLGFTRIEKLAHIGESLLDHIRAGRLAVQPAIITQMLAMSDALRSMLHTIEANGNEGDPDNSALIQSLHELSAPIQIKPAVPPKSAPPAPAAATPPKPVTTAPSPAPSVPAPASPAVTPPAPAAATPTGNTNNSFGLFTAAPFSPAQNPPAKAPVPATPAPSGNTNNNFGLFTAPPFQAPAPSAPAPATPPSPSRAPTPPPTEATPAAPRASIADSAIRVDVSILDKLMNLVGELVLARNQIVQRTGIAADTTLQAASQRLNIITTELQEGVMKTRMQPIDTIWAKFPRIVRDVAHELGKNVHLDFEGKNTELDRTILEAIKDPLTHIIRNSVDHGIEPAEKRIAAGKPADGHILMRAYHEGGQVNIEIIDDGGGINTARVKAKAIEKKIVTPEEAARLSERDLINLIFAPGFSTAEKITNVSGRGVGMDVVKTNIEKIGGSVDVQSQLGQGTILKIKIPLTLAIVPALIVRTSGQRFAIPQVNLLELVRLEGQAARDGIEQVYDKPVFRLRGQLLPLAYLQRELKLPAPAAPSEVVNIVVLQADGHTFGLVLDQVCDTEEIVVKPLGKQLKGLPMFAGATIMGDGQVALIIDVIGLSAHAHIGSAASKDRTTTLHNTTQASSTTNQATSQLLIFSLPGRDRLAIRLEQAERLEEFPAEKIERSGAREAVQYRGQIMPLVRLSEKLPGARTEASAQDSVQVIVCERLNQTIGLVVGDINDIVEDVVSLQPGTAAPGIAGSAVIQGRITDLVDVPALLREIAA